MPYYVSTVHVVIVADRHTVACDIMHSLMRESDVGESHVVDWGYANTLVPVPDRDRAGWPRGMDKVAGPVVIPLRDDSDQGDFRKLLPDSHVITHDDEAPGKRHPDYIKREVQAAVDRLTALLEVADLMKMEPSIGLVIGRGTTGLPVRVTYGKPETP